MQLLVYNLDYIENIIFRFLLDICEKINKTELIYSLYFLLYILLFFVHLEPPTTYVPIWLERNLGQPCACSFKFYCYTVKRLEKIKKTTKCNSCTRNMYVISNCSFSPWSVWSSPLLDSLQCDKRKEKPSLIKYSIAIFFN